MQYYLAPLEGITTFVYRNAVGRYFGGIDKYFTPFFSPQTKRHKNSYAIRGILPENNKGINLVPQILTDDAKDFLKFEKDMHSYGYRELNINLGCPSGTVVSKGRGAAFLTRTQELNHFLEEVFSAADSEISVKTRLGMADPEEFCRILDIYNRYPLNELIIHFRVGREMYSGEVHKEYIDYAIMNSKIPVVYNGDIFEPSDTDMLPESISTVMLGRGMVADPSLARQLQSGEKASKEELSAFLHYLKEEYYKLDQDQNHILFKLKEVWSYLQKLFPDNPREIKRILKSKTLDEYQINMEKIL